MTDVRVAEVMASAPPAFVSALGRMSEDAKTVLIWQWTNQPENRAAIEASVQPPTSAMRGPPEIQRDPTMRAREKAAIYALGKIPEYSGKKANDAARLWLRDCEHYFEKLQRRSVELVADYEKIDTAESRLRGEAERHWRSHLEAVARGRQEKIESWSDFKAWILELFGEHFSERIRWSRFYNLMQRDRERVRDFAMKLGDAASLLEPEAPPPYVVRQRLLDGIPKGLLRKWTEERIKPTELQETIRRLAELEEGALVGQMTDPDAMDLSALDARPSRRPGAPNESAKRGNWNPRKDSAIERQNRTAPVRKCFRCSSTKHLIRDCPKGPQAREDAVPKQLSGKGKGR